MKFVRKVMQKWQNHGSETNRQTHELIDMGTNWKATTTATTKTITKAARTTTTNTTATTTTASASATAMTTMITNTNNAGISTSTATSSKDVGIGVECCGIKNFKRDTTTKQGAVNFNISIKTVNPFCRTNTLSKVQRSYIEDATKPPRFLAKRQKEDYMYDGSFHQAIGKVLLMAEFFALMPVRGVTKPHPKQLSFSWMSIRTLYCILFIVITIIDMGLACYKVLNRPITFNTVEPLIFRSSIIIVCVSALNLASKWPTLMQHWHKVERDLPPYTTQTEKSRLAYQIRMVTFVAMMLSLCEHLLSQLAVIQYSNLCPITDNPIKNFFLRINDEIFHVFEYSNFLAWLGKIEAILLTFTWNYMDVFVMNISLGLASKFRQLNDNLVKFKGMHMPESFWSERRIQYRNLCVLCDKMDNAISVITMVSFSNNLYFICVQLLKSLNKMPSIAHALYFYYSLIFLLGRTLAVSLYSASVNDESRQPLRVLRCVPKGSWCPEVKRFAEEISSDLVALSGMKFFHLTRNLVLSVAGTIVTYELVLIQFHEDNGSWKCDGLTKNATINRN